MRWIVAAAPFASVKAAGSNWPIDESAATADPSVTGSNSASCRTPVGAVAATTTVWLSESSGRRTRARSVCFQMRS